VKVNQTQMAFKPYCQTCSSWHNTTEPHIMANFSSILDMPASEWKFPKLPVGSYVGIIKGMPRYDKSAKKQTPFVEFQIQLTEAMDDVDTDELEAFGPFTEKTMPITFYYDTEGGANRLKAFLDNIDIDITGRPAREAIEEAPGRTIVVEIKHTPSQDGQSIYAQIDGTARYGE
jgi:hypothetical protein